MSDLVVRHLVDRKPERNNDASRVLCVRSGETKVKDAPPNAEVPERRLHGWTLDATKVTCRRCLEWIHA